jgi:hypothetical protein
VADDLLEQFKLALAAEDVEGFGECVRRLGEAYNSGQSPRESFRALVGQLGMILDRHEGLLRQWAAEDPEFTQVLGHLGKLLETMAS